MYLQDVFELKDFETETEVEGGGNHLLLYISATYNFWNVKYNHCFNTWMLKVLISPLPCFLLLLFHFLAPAWLCKDKVMQGKESQRKWLTQTIVPLSL